MKNRVKLRSTDINTATLNYYVLTNVIYNRDTRDITPIYGCEVELVRSNQTEPERKSFAGAFSSKSEIEEFVERLCTSKITPCTLYDAVYDYICE